MVSRNIAEEEVAGPAVAGPAAFVEDRTTPLITGVSRAPWGAIIAGAVMGLAIQGLLTLLGLAIGLSVARHSGADANSTDMGAAAGIYLLISMIISYFIGGWVTGCMVARTSDTKAGILHGSMTWGLMVVLGFLFLSGALGVILNGATNLGSQSAMATGQMADTNQVNNQALSDRETGNTPGRFVSDRTDNTQTADQNTRQIRQQARIAARQTTDVAAKASWWNFFAMLLALGAAIGGGVLGVGGREGRMRRLTGSPPTSRT